MKVSLRCLFSVFLILSVTAWPLIAQENIQTYKDILSEQITVTDTLIAFETEEITISEPLVVHDQKESFNPYKFRGTELIAPAVLLGIGVIGLENNWWKGINRDIRDNLQKNHHKKIPVDDYTQFLPILADYGLKLCGVKGLHDMVDISIIYATAYLLMAATLYPMKDFINCERPNRRNFQSFPSGHTAISFVGAEVLRREYWHVSPWIGVAGYLFAAGTGFMRIYNNAHWLNDVIAGAGLGILCAEAAYWLYPAVTKSLFPKRYKANVYLAPSASPQHISLSCAISF